MEWYEVNQFLLSCYFSDWLHFSVICVIEGKEKNHRPKIEFLFSKDPTRMKAMKYLKISPWILRRKGPPSTKEKYTYTTCLVSCVFQHYPFRNKHWSKIRKWTSLIRSKMFFRQFLWVRKVVKKQWVWESINFKSTPHKKKLQETFFSKWVYV